MCEWSITDAKAAFSSNLLPIFCCCSIVQAINLDLFFRVELQAFAVSTSFFFILSLFSRIWVNKIKYYPVPFSAEM